VFAAFGAGSPMFFLLYPNLLAFAFIMSCLIFSIGGVITNSSFGRPSAAPQPRRTHPRITPLIPTTRRRWLVMTSFVLRLGVDLRWSESSSDMRGPGDPGAPRRAAGD